jgi:hypothetical protein
LHEYRARQTPLGLKALESMIRKSGYRFSEKIMLKQKMARDDDSEKSHPAAA